MPIAGFQMAKVAWLIQSILQARGTIGPFFGDVMESWPTLPEQFRKTGELLLKHDDHGEVALLATINSAGNPAVSPVCPVFTETAVYLLVGRETPKYRHLQQNPRYALHAQVGAEDLEFQISGESREVHDEAERQQVLNAIAFPSFDKSDPVFELRINRALVVTWQAGEPQKTAWAG